MNVSKTMAPKRTIITHKYAVTTGNASVCTFFTRSSFARNTPYGFGSSGPPQALDHPGHESGYRAHDGTVDEAAEEGGSPKDDRLQAGGELVLEVAAEARWVAIPRRLPRQLMADRQRDTVSDADDYKSEKKVRNPPPQRGYKPAHQRHERPATRRRRYLPRRYPDHGAPRGARRRPRAR